MKGASRSWLADVKSVHKIGALFYQTRGGKPWSDKEDAQADWRWRNAGVRPLPVAAADARYFGSAMHDSGTLGVARAAGPFRLRLDSVNARDFAVYLADTLELPRVETTWPVDLVLHDAAYVRAARADHRGGLRFVDPEGLAGTEFLYDWFFREDGRLQWIAQLWSRPARWVRGEQIYLMVDAARATAEDRCAATFARLYGEAASRLYRDAVAEIDDRPIDFNVYDSRHTPDYILRRMAAHGFTREDFVEPPDSVRSAASGDV